MERKEYNYGYSIGHTWQPEPGAAAGTGDATVECTRCTRWLSNEPLLHVYKYPLCHATMGAHRRTHHGSTHHIMGYRNRYISYWNSYTARSWLKRSQHESMVPLLLFDRRRAHRVNHADRYHRDDEDAAGAFERPLVVCPRVAAARHVLVLP